MKLNGEHVATQAETCAAELRVHRVKTFISAYYLEGEFGRRARSDWTERAPEVDGGGKRTGSQQDRSLDQQTHKNKGAVRPSHGSSRRRERQRRVSVYHSVGGDDSRGEGVGRRPRSQQTVDSCVHLHGKQDMVTQA